MNLTRGGEQPFLWDGYYTEGDDRKYTQPIWYSLAREAEQVEIKDRGNQGAGRRSVLIADPENLKPIMIEGGKKVQNGFQYVLEERGLWPEGGLQLECSKNLCASIELAKNCHICKSR